MICPYCKETILDGALKCRFCGSMLNLEPAGCTPIDSISSEEIRAFVGTNSHYYIQNFSKFTLFGVEKFCVTWNWSTFGFTFLWMLYRKMYVLAVITFIIFWLPGINILLHIVAGFTGNYLYYRHVKENIQEIRSIQTPRNFYPVLQEAGGVNKWIISSGIIISILLALIFMFFFATITTYMGQHLVRMTI